MKEIIAITAGLLLTFSAYALTDAEEYKRDLDQTSISISKAADMQLSMFLVKQFQ